MITASPSVFNVKSQVITPMIGLERISTLDPGLYTAAVTTVSFV